MLAEGRPDVNDDATIHINECVITDTRPGEGPQPISTAEQVLDAIEARRITVERCHVYVENDRLYIEPIGALT
jgi:hypothetical protein